MTVEPSAFAAEDAEHVELLQWLNSGEPHPESLISSGYQGSAYLYQGAEGPLVVKAAHGRGLVGSVRRWMIRHEYRAYQRLIGISGVPRCYGLLDGQYLLIEYIDGRQLSDVGRDLDDSQTYYDALLIIIKAMHAAGVAHSDLKRRDNVLVTTAGTPCIIDFGTAFLRSDPGSWLNQRIFALMKQFDFNAWIKLKYRTHYETISDADRPYFRPTLLERVVRSLRKLWQAVSLRKLRKARQRARESESGG